MTSGRKRDIFRRSDKKHLLNGVRGMKKAILNNQAISCMVIFSVLIAVHAFEAIVLRMDETIFAENFINKVFGIIVTAAIIKVLDWQPKDIGLSKTKIAGNIGKGFLLAGFSFLIAFLAEIMILVGQNRHLSVGFYTTGFSLTGSGTVNSGIAAILMCVFFNIINVVMEEGTFRGLLFRIAQTYGSDKTAVMFQAFLFGIWHIVTPLHNFIDGDIGLLGFILLSLGYIVLAGIMGIKWSIMYKLTGSLYAGMADHFFNNCVATNLLHISTETGTDEMLLVRVLIAQVISFAAVMAFNTKAMKEAAKKAKRKTSR